MKKNGSFWRFTVAALGYVFIAQPVHAQLYDVVQTVIECTGTCDSFAALDVGTQITGNFIIEDPAPGTVWVANDVTLLELSLLNPAAPLEPYVGSNATTANPFPITLETVDVEPTGGGQTTGGAFSVFASPNAPMLLRLSGPPLDANDAWFILDFADGLSMTTMLCLFFDTAGCIPGATLALVAEGEVAFIDPDPQMVASPSPVDFGTVLVGASAQRVVTVTNNGLFAKDLQQLGGLADPFDFRADQCSLQVLMPAAECQFTVKFQPQVTGNFGDSVAVDWVNASPPISVPLVGTGTDPAVDEDADGILDASDNCLGVANPDQRDTNGDGFGNLCDADLNDDCIVNAIDLGIFKLVFFTADPDADFDGNGVVNVLDLAVIKGRFFSAPGPSGQPNGCPL